MIYLQGSCQCLIDDSGDISSKPRRTSGNQEWLLIGA
jgi:hypothetical protein